MNNDYSENYYNYITAENAFGSTPNPHSYGFAGTSRNLNEGAPKYTVISYAMNWLGPVYENNFYPTSEKYDTPIMPEEIDIPAKRHVHGYRKIATGPKNVTDKTYEAYKRSIEIKELISEGCAAILPIYLLTKDSNYYNKANRSQYFPIEESSSAPFQNHVVTIVGWDDTYSKYNFGSRIPPEDGAFILKNSWGTGGIVGDGYYYISYYDVYIYYSALYAFTDVKDGNIYFRNYGIGEMYDRGTTYEWQTPSNVLYMANTYKKKSGVEYLKEVGFYAAEYNTEYEIFVNPNNDILTENNLISVASGTIQKPGFNTIALNHKLLINASENDYFGVVIKISAPENSSSYKLKYATTVSSSVSSKEKDGRSLISTDLNNWSNYFDTRTLALNIRAYTLIDDYGNDFENVYNQNILLGQVNSLNGALEDYDDVDMFKFTAPITGSYKIYSTNSNVDVKAWLYNSSYSLLTSNDDGNGYPNFKITYNLTAGQTYYLKVSHWNQNGTGTYTLNFEFIDDYGNDLANAYNWPLQPSYKNSRNATLEYKNDVDVYKFTAPDTGIYVLYSTDCVPDVKAWLYNSSGAAIINNDDGGQGLNFRIQYDLTAGQTYYLKVSHYSQNGIGNYTVNIATPTSLDTLYNANINTPGKEISFKFTPTNSGVYCFYSENNSGDPYGHLYDADGYRLAYNDDGAGNRNFTISYWLNAGQTYYYKARLYSSSSTGTFDVKLVTAYATTYNITYNGNGSGVGGVPTSDKKVYGINLTLSRATPTRNGYIFLGWSTKSTATTPTYYKISTNLTFSTNANTTLYAVWCKQGDIDLDASVTVSDIVKLRAHLMADPLLTGYYLIAADVNRDGAINDDDLTAIRDIISGGSAQMASFLNSIIYGTPLESSVLSERFLLGTDWNGDGAINSEDTLLIRDVISKTQGSSPQVEQFLSITASDVIN